MLPVGNGFLQHLRQQQVRQLQQPVQQHQQPVQQRVLVHRVQHRHQRQPVQQQHYSYEDYT